MHKSSYLEGSRSRLGSKFCESLFLQKVLLRKQNHVHPFFGGGPFWTDKYSTLSMALLKRGGPEFHPHYINSTKRRVPRWPSAKCRSLHILEVLEAEAVQDLSSVRACVFTEVLRKQNHMHPFFVGGTSLNWQVFNTFDGGFEKDK